MPKTIPVETEEWCPDYCPNFSLGYSNYYLDNAVETYFYCDNRKICRVAVNNFKQWRKEHDNVQSDISE